MKRRVLVLCGDRGIPLYGPSGASAHLRGVVRALAEGDDAVHVAVHRLSDKRGRVDTPDIPVPLTTRKPRDWAWIPRRWREHGLRWDALALAKDALRDGAEPDLIYERYSLFCDAGVRIAEQRHVPRVVELNAPLSIERGRYGGIRDPSLARKLEREALRTADRVCTVSAWLARWAVEEVGCLPERVRHVPNGVDHRRRGKRDEVRQRLNLDGLVIGFLGSMRPWHGIDLIPEILDHLPEAKALLVGDGPATPAAHPRIHHVGRVPPAEVADYVSAMDVALAPYRGDAPQWFCPLKLLDYRAQGVPIVAADVGDCRDLTGDAGEIVESANPIAWAHAIRRQGTRRVQPWVRSWNDVVTEALEGL